MSCVPPAIRREPVPRRSGGLLFDLRLWLGDRLLQLGALVQPAHRYNHRVSRDGETITIWREPA